MTDPTMPHLACAEAVERLWELLDADQPVHDDARLSTHLAWCLRCCGELEFAEHLRAMLRDRGKVEIPAGARSRLEAVIDDLSDDEGAIR